MEHPLISLYGNTGIKDTLKEIQNLKENSNIPFDTKYIELGISFLNIKAEEIVENKKSKPTLKALVSESFGEAAIYKYNCCKGVL